jgi:hypothetical protein
VDALGKSSSSSSNLSNLLKVRRKGADTKEKKRREILKSSTIIRE